MGKNLEFFIEQQNADGTYKLISSIMTSRWTILDNFIDGMDKHSLVWEMTDSIPYELFSETEICHEEAYCRSMGFSTTTKGFKDFLDKTRTVMITYSGEDEEWVDIYLQRHYDIYNQMREQEKNGLPCRIIFHSSI